MTYYLGLISIGLKKKKKNTTNVFTRTYLLFCLSIVGKLQQLVKFWVGWELPSAGMKVKWSVLIIQDHQHAFPNSPTAWSLQYISRISMDLEACIATCDTGFGLI